MLAAMAVYLLMMLGGGIGAMVLVPQPARHDCHRRRLGSLQRVTMIQEYAPARRTRAIWGVRADPCITPCLTVVDRRQGIR
jgi:hypothetical protein